MLVLLNLLVLGGLGILLIAEEVRYRQFKSRVEATQASLVSLAHQLRSPLTNVRKYIQFLETQAFGSLSIAQHEAVTRMRTSLADAVILLERLLARSKIEEGAIAAAPIRLNVAQSVLAAISAVRPIADERRHRVIVRDQSRGAPVFADPLLLHGIFDEILMNAISYTPRKGTVRVNVLSGGRSVHVAIRDTGIGIRKEERPHIFEKFFRGKRASAMAPGSGLGLSFARAFAAECGGSIRFTSSVRSGTTFTVTLPKAKRS